MKITDGLLGEHALFYAVFDALDSVMDDSASLEEIQRAWATILPGILSHAALEDELLFPAVEGQVNGPLTVMREEHRQIEAMAAGMAHARDIDDGRAKGRELLDLLRDHFHKEEAVLFPMCERAAGERSLLELGEQWRVRRRLS